MQIENFRTGTAEIVNDLNNLLNNVTDPDEQRAIQRLLRKMNARHDAIVSEDIKKNTDKYKKALSSLRKAEKEPPFTSWLRAPFPFSRASKKLLKSRRREPFLGRCRL